MYDIDLHTLLGTGHCHTYCTCCCWTCVTVTDVPTASLFAYQFCRVGLPLFPVPDLFLDLKSIAVVIRSIISILFRLAHIISMEKFSEVMTIFPWTDTKVCCPFSWLGEKWILLTMWLIHMLLLAPIESWWHDFFFLGWIRCAGYLCTTVLGQGALTSQVSCLFPSMGLGEIKSVWNISIAQANQKGLCTQPLILTCSEHIRISCGKFNSTDSSICIVASFFLYNCWGCAFHQWAKFDHLIWLKKAQ